MNKDYKNNSENKGFMVNESCKILFVGDSSYEMYVKAFYNAARNMSCITPMLVDFGKLNTAVSKKNALLRVERHYKLGLDVSKINKEIINYVYNNEVDIVFLYACDIVTVKTVRRLTKKAYVAVYNNDNPFSEYYQKYKWRNVLHSCKYADTVYSYRESNISEYKKCGAKKVKLMRSYYIKERNYYIPDEKIDMQIPDVCFIGHYEDDERIEYIRELADTGIDVGIPESWKSLNIDNDHLIYIAKTHSKYNDILNKTKIAIVFLSSINKDTYTRRCFEIPAVRTLMVAPFTPDIASMYEDSKEVVLYNNKTEFIEKISYYLEHDEERRNIAEAGYRRLIKDGNEVTDRIDQIINDWKKSNKK